MASKEIRQNPYLCGCSSTHLSLCCSPLIHLAFPQIIRWLRSASWTRYFQYLTHGSFYLFHWFLFYAACLPILWLAAPDTQVCILGVNQRRAELLCRDPSCREVCYLHSTQRCSSYEGDSVPGGAWFRIKIRKINCSTSAPVQTQIV